MGSQLVTVGFLGQQWLSVQAFDVDTLKIKIRYDLELSAAWMLRSKVTDGFLLLLGLEDPFFGATFTVDLRSGSAYEQDPPLPIPGLAQRKSRRQQLPQHKPVEDLGEEPWREGSFCELRGES